MDGLMMGDIEPIFANEDVRVATPETTGQRIHWLRRYTLKMKQKDFAAALGTSQGFMSEIESDKKEAGNTLLVKIADLLHTTTDYLLLRTDDPSPPEDAKPTFLYLETEQAAHMIDGIAQPEIRAQCLSAVVELYNGYKERAAKEKHIRELLALIEASNGAEYRREIERQLGLRSSSIQSSGQSPAL